MKKKHITTLLAASTLALLTACGGSSNTSASPTGTGDIPEGSAYTWEAGAYPTDAPSLLTKEDRNDLTGWYMGVRESASDNKENQSDNLNRWQTIYSYKDSVDPRGATVATIFYDDLEKCTLGGSAKVGYQASSVYVSAIMQDQRGLNTSAHYEYVFSGEGRTFPHPNDAEGAQSGRDYTKSLNNIPSNADDLRSPNSSVEDAEIYTMDASSQVGVHAADAVNTPGRTATFFANYTKDSNGELVPTGCATVYTALSEEASGVYDQAKFTEAYEQAIAFAKEIEKMPVKKAVEQKQAP